MNQKKNKKNKDKNNFFREVNKMDITIEQRRAYSELLEILRHMDKKYVNKIPKKVIMFLYDNCQLDYDFRMTKPIGEEKFMDKTLDLLALINLSYWEKEKDKDKFVLEYSIINKSTQNRLNNQLEKQNIYTKIDDEHKDTFNKNVPTLTSSFSFGFKKFLNFIKNAFIKFFGD